MNLMTPWLSVIPNWARLSHQALLMVGASLAFQTGYAQCLTAPGGENGTLTPTCNGTTQTITVLGRAREYSTVQLTAGNTYTFSISTAGEFITIATTAPAALAWGTTPLTYTAVTTGPHRFYHHLNAACGTQGAFSFVFKTRSVSCVEPPCSGTPAAVTVSGTSTPVCGTAAARTYTRTAGPSGFSGLSYQWAYSLTPGGALTNVGTLNALTYTTTAGVTQTRYYKVVSTCSNGGGTAVSNEIPYVVNPVPSATAGGNSPICEGATLNLTGTTDIGTSHSWTGPSGFTSGAQNPTRPLMTSADAGSYIYTATVTATGCVSAASNYSVSVNPGLSIPVITPPSATTCAGAGQLLTAAASSNATVLSSPFNSTGGPATITVTNAQNASIYPWNLVISGLPASGITVASVSINGVAHTFPDDLDILLQSPTGTNVVLMSDAGGNTDVTATNWTFSTGSPAMSDAGTNSSGTYSPTNIGASDDFPTAPGPGNGFSQASPSLSLFTGNFNGTWKLLIRDDANGDAGSVTSWSITFNLPAPVSYTWSPNVALSGTTGPSVTASPTNTQMYTVTASHGPNACTRSADVTITTVDPPNAGTDATLTICSNAAAASLVAQLGGAPDGGGSWSGPSPVVGGMYDPTTMSPGSYLYTVNASPCAPAVATVTVTEDPATVWYADADNDGAGDPNVSLMACAQPLGYVANDNDVCLGGPEPGQACNDGDPCTINDVVNGSCTCSGTFAGDSDNDGTCDPLDVCPGSPEPGMACNDGNPFTTGDVVNGACACVGTPVPCTENVVLDLHTDNAGGETSWEIKDANSPFVVCSGNSYSSNSMISLNCCLVPGCYVLNVFDSFGDGMTTGGYVLRTMDGDRIIDNESDGQFTFQSSSPLGFCVPMGTDKLTVFTCDREDLSAGSVIVASANPAVAGEFGVGNQSDDGYQFWIYDPDGSYSRRIYKSHASPGAGGAPGADACAHLKLSSIVTSPVPADKLLNVRVRSKVNNTFAEFGPACRMMVLSTPIACPTTQLDNNPLHVGTTLSCGATGKMVGASGNSGKLWPNLVPGANKYQYEFAFLSENYLRTISPPTGQYALMLGNWVTNPLLCGTFEYDVRVRASFDGGATWCPWGPVCTVEITNNPPNNCSGFGGFTGGGGLNSLEEPETEVLMWPNPVRDGHVQLQLNALSTDATEVTIDIFDLFGKRVMARTIATEGAEELTTVLEVETSMAKGLYMVNITIGDKLHVQRLVIE